MSKCTFIKASEVKPFIVDEIYSSRMLLDRTNSDSQSVQINLGTFAPGGKQEDHSHSPEFNNDEIYLILKGEGRLRLDGQEYDVSPGDIAYIPAGSMHALANKSETEELVIYTVWTRQPEKGANPVYDQRLEAWGKSYKTIHEE
ncbi:cupin domain-containing protein [Paenibacillus mendelii]|uniref:Cupin domain-containing protein n=1 Tax=Paenibacillus mendelii TaxID=206163 RepID=A0ABV6J364_9BACL|nr:cupin domain-containing protein [Paenibacillus mendelii]MCQ6559410.1 cupin domain-containing protein [Paenibacillus mendelii]